LAADDRVVVELEVEMDVMVERQGALEVHKEQVTACVRVPDERGERISHVAEFKTTVRGLLVLRDWLKAHHVTQVTMEATGVLEAGGAPRGAM
jgi:hypothetical protein